MQTSAAAEMPAEIPAEIPADIQGLAKTFGKGDAEVRALRPFDAEIAAGRLTGLVGPDGAGKTTLLRILAALMHPSQGRVRVMGHDVTEAADEIHPVVGYMPQRFGLYEDLSVIQNLRLYSRLRGLRGEELRETFERLLDFTRLAPFTSRLAGDLSGGMKQKLGLACALMGKPDLLLLDEPSVGVDPVSRRELWQMVNELAGEGMAVVWSTAYLDEAERCESVLLLNEGKLEFDGSPGELTSRIAGRSFRLAGLGAERREVLSRALERDEVRDGVIQGRSVRVVLAEDAGPDILDELAKDAGGHGDAADEDAGDAGDGVSVEEVSPRFEDAFIDLLGGGPGGRSALAEAMDSVEWEGEDDDVAVEARRLTRRFGDFTAARDVEFRVRRGEVFGLLGPNGAGKSTTFKMLCGLLEPSEGQARVAGFDLRTAPSEAKRRLGYMAQKFSLYGLLSVGQNLEFFSGAYDLRGRERRRRVDEMIETFGLERYLDVSPDTLPLGYKQRLALSCALMHRPPVLFLDEPTSGVDPITRREFWTHINGLVRKGVTVLVTTHFMDEAEYCDRVALMFRGELIALDSPDELKARAETDETPDPTMEDAFVHLVEEADVERQEVAA